MSGDTIGRMGFAHPPEWATWLPHSGAEVADQIASLVTTTEEGCARVAAEIRSCQRELAAVPGLTQAGIWVPDPSDGLPSGFMFASMVSGDETIPSPAAYANHLRAAKAPRGVRIFDHGVTEANVALGPAVVEVEIAAPRRGRQVVSSVTWMVFPTGYTDAVRMYFRTPYPDLLEPLADEARIMVDELVLEPAGEV